MSKLAAKQIKAIDGGEWVAEFEFQKLKMESASQSFWSTKKIRCNLAFVHYNGAVTLIMIFYPFYSLYLMLWTVPKFQFNLGIFLQKNKNNLINIVNFYISKVKITFKQINFF